MSRPDRWAAMPSFSDFYRAINDRAPFPWQVRLADRVSEQGKWPREIGVPTGLGKTACLDIAVWWLAAEAHRAPRERTAPTRIWWLVNRRLLVDSTAAHAEKIRRALVDPESIGASGESGDVLGCVATRLRAISSDPHGDPLEVIRLRGGVQSRLPTDPSRPAVLLSTLPMFGSRLLFRGYGASRSMRPVHAAMCGTDSLILVDEAHLVRHLVHLIPDLVECNPDARDILGGARSRPQVVALTATGDASKQDRFDLDSQDEANDIVRRRLDAAKSLRIRQTGRNPVPGMVAEAWSLIRKATAPTTGLVFANTPVTARAVFDKLAAKSTRSLRHKVDFALLTGRTREREAERTRARVLDPVAGMLADRDADAQRDRHLVVVATQTLEVGADIDAEFLVTETCGVRALTQRLGRLNRLGRFKTAEAVYIHYPGKRQRGQPERWVVYGNEPTSVIERLESALGTGETVDVSPRNISAVLGEPGDNPGRAPEILPGILWEWVKTTSPPDGEAPVEPYFSGIAGPDYTVSLIWRAHVPEEGERIWPRASDREAIAVPIGEVKDTFGGDGELRRLGPDRATIEGIEPDRIRPGNILVLPTDRGFLDEFGWNPESPDPVVDMSILQHGIPLHALALKRLCGVAVRGLVKTALGDVPDDEDLDETDQVNAVEEIVQALGSTTAFGWDDAEWSELLANLDRQVIQSEGEVSRLVLRQRTDAGDRNEELDEFSLAPGAVELGAHGEAVGARSRLIAKRVGLADELCEVIQLAGRSHDLGKSDPRFQRWLDPSGASDKLLAKSSTPAHRWAATRRVAGWPRGGRHEALSARLICLWLESGDRGLTALQRDLLIHLVISHHGSGRPLVPPIKDDTLGTVSATLDGKIVQASGSLAETDWDHPARFRRLHDEYGPWALALMEAIVRQSDHAVSGGAQVQQQEDEA